MSGVDAQQAVQPDAASRLSQLVVGSILVIAFVLFAFSGRATNVVVRAWPMLALPALAIMSATWAPDSSIALRRGAAYFGTILFGLSLATRLSLVESVRLLTATLSLATLLSLIWVYVFPAYGVNQAADVAAVQVGLWRGIFGHKNQLGLVSGLAFGLLVVYGRFVFNYWVLRSAALAVSVACLIGAQSVTGYVTAAILPCALILLSWFCRLDRQAQAFAFVLALLGSGLAAAFLNNLMSLSLGLLDRDVDFSGRIPYWHYVLQAIGSEDLLLGVGYAGYGLTVGPVIASAAGLSTLNAHNGYLEILVAFGYVGVTIFACIIAWSVWQSYRILVLAPRDRSAVMNVFPIGIILMALLTNVVESTFLLTYHVTPMLLGVSAAMFARTSELPASRKARRGHYGQLRPLLQIDNE
jgi:O-antigen ligase